ncbi:MAG: hypothetical protein V2I43_18425, partial [Parvularcula sp.]|nr:hypothetical protein [Parvularcula sp.]
TDSAPTAPAETYRLVPNRVATQPLTNNFYAGTYALEPMSAGNYDHLVPTSMPAPSQELGVACLSVASGSARVYETALVSGRPSCGADQAVRLYRSR